MKKSILLSVLCVLFTGIYAQNISVQTLTYPSQTRDTIIDFPDIDHNEYEKIIMYYSMRCKNAQVSTGSNRNLGCGEWDYSCNTYVVDESKVDSFKQVSPEYDFVGRGGETFSYTDRPTYSYTARNHYQVEYSDIISESEHIVIGEDIEHQIDFGKQGQGFSMQYIVTAEILSSSGVAPAKSINAMQWPIYFGDGTVHNLKIRTQWIDNPSMDEVSDSWNENYFLTTFLDQENNQLDLYEPLFWDGSKHLVVWVTYDNISGSGISVGSELAPVPMRYSLPKENRFWSFGPSGHVEIESDFTDIKSEITIAFWQFGYDNLPVSSTLLEGVDASDRRQVNIHLPWGNSQVYWDCGSDGNYDRINKTADASNFKNKWNHWAFTKNATTGIMRIYLNGELWHEGVDKFREIDIKKFKIGQNYGGNNYNYSRLDDFMIFSSALDEDLISEIMSNSADTADSYYEDLFVHYSFDQEVSELIDNSSNSRMGTVYGQLLSTTYPAEESENNWITHQLVPGLTLRQDSVITNVTSVRSLDSIPNLPQRVDQYRVDGTDLQLVGTEYYYADDAAYITNAEGNIIDSIVYPNLGVLERGELNYFSKRPMEFEVMSFVTPYGIGIDFGEEGHTWTFDVTHLGPVLKGRKRLYLTRGGQWQEEMDIRFEYIKGTPDRDVIEINNLWPTSGTVSYQNIQSDWRYEPRQIIKHPDADETLIKMAITGHRQEGEFVPRDHQLSFKIGTIDLPVGWRVWKECADNPIFPQGGTWIYDRAGWCPGMATDIQDVDISNYFNRGDTIIADYNIPIVQGASSYIVSSQLVSYGPPNKMLDAGIEDVIYPTTKIEYARYNPTCQVPKIVLKNHGSDDLTEVVVDYGIEGGSMQSYTWKGQLGFLRTEEIELDFLNDIGNEDTFYVRIRSANGQEDTHINNNVYMTKIDMPDNYNEEFIIDFRTNNLPQETQYRIFDQSGDQVLYRGGNLTANRNYRDTLRGLQGCYRMLIEDQGDNGLDFWAQPSAGFGYIQVKGTDGVWNRIADDFGKFIEYNFTAGVISSVDDITESLDFEIYPNPVSDELYIKNMEGMNNSLEISITDQLGKRIHSYRETIHNLANRPIRSVHNLSKGIYFISISDGEKSALRKFIKI